MPKPKTAPENKLASSKAAKIIQGENDIFALDIGTRNVVGIMGHIDDGVFTVEHAVSVPHKRRAMMDGQIEDINETAKIVGIVKERLEKETGMTLTHVAIAAAGRALKTKLASVVNEIEGKDKITEDMLKSLELEAVAKAQDELDAENDNESISFYCVGHTVIRYKLDDYPIRSLLGHKGKTAAVELIAAFLPGIVVESLYTVMDMCSLEVKSLTLEPIAAMNVIIPPEVRLINIALVDIGAGTTDIAISRNGSIVAYAMATIAGDEITEEIIKKYLVDFQTAEEMKLGSSEEEIVFTDILGFEHTLSTKDFFESLYPAVDQLADTIAENIIATNGSSPAAVFLVGGGSLIPDLAKMVADKLEIPENRVAIGGQNNHKNVIIGNSGAFGPEFVTPIGIGITATYQTGYDFSIVTLNGNRTRIFDTKSITVAELLMNAGYKTPQIIGRSGRGLTFTLNGEKQNVRGETSAPAQISVNGQPVSLEYTVKQGDAIEFIPAIIGMNAAVTISDIAGEITSKKVVVDGAEFSFGTTARVNDVIVSGDYNIQNFDNISIETIETLEDLIMSLPLDCSKLAFYKDNRPVRSDYVLCENDTFETKERGRNVVSSSVPNRAREIAMQDEKASRTVSVLSSIPLEAPSADTKPASVAVPLSVPPQEAAAVKIMERKPVTAHERTIQETRKIAEPNTEKAEIAMHTAEPVEDDFANEFYRAPEMGSITVYLNGKPTLLEANDDGTQHEFLELMALADIDISNPPTSGKMILSLNGKNASFMDPLKSGDEIIIRWDS